MKWKLDWKSWLRTPEIGEERIIKRFPIVPVTINGETRWLENCKIKQRYTYVPLTDRTFWRNTIKWVDVEWVDK